MALKNIKKIGLFLALVFFIGLPLKFVSAADQTCAWFDGNVDCNATNTNKQGDFSTCGLAENSVCSNAEKNGFINGINSGYAKVLGQFKKATCCCCSPNSGCCKINVKSATTYELLESNAAKCGGENWTRGYSEFIKAGTGVCTIFANNGCCECEKQKQMDDITIDIGKIFMPGKNQADCDKVPENNMPYNFEKCVYVANTDGKSCIGINKQNEVNAQNTAQSNNNNGNNPTNQSAVEGFDPTPYMPKEGFEFELPTNSLGNGSFNVPALLGRPLSLLFSLVGSLALLLYIYAGWNWMTAMGNAKKIETAQSIIIWTSASLIALSLAYVFVRFVFDIISKV